MKLLVSTVRCLLLVDLKTRVLTILEAHRPEYYGISWFPNTDQLVLGHSNIDNNSLLSLEDYALSERGEISIGGRIVKLFLSQAHQLQCAENGWIIITNTGRNCITIYDPNTQFKRELVINDVRWDRLSKGDKVGEHFNSIYIADRKMYVLAHSFNKGSYILEYSYPECEIVDQHELSGSEMHNIWIDSEKNFITCKTLTGELIEGKTDTLLWKANCPVYLRGLAATDDIIILGGTEVSNDRNMRQKSESELWVIDRKNYQTLDCVQLGSYGAVHDIRVIDVPDHAHHGVPLKNIDRLSTYSKIISNERAQQRLKSSRIQNKLNADFQIEIGNLIQRGEWYQGIDSQLVIAVFPTEYTNKYQASLEYQFEKKSQHQHLSLIFSHRQKGDSDMFAILLNYVAEGCTTIEYWGHDQKNWKRFQIISDNVSQEGRLIVNKFDDYLEILCNNETFSIPAHSSIPSGKVGVRCFGGKFKNFKALNMND